MIYLFGDKKNLSAVFGGETLTLEQKKSAVYVIDKLPNYLRKDGYAKRLCFDDVKLYWEYDLIEEEVKDDTQGG